MRSLTFFGAVGGAVVPSRYLLKGNNCRDSILVECGALIDDNAKKRGKEARQDFAHLDPRSVGQILISHGHTDHGGALTGFIEQGCRANITSTDPTKDILEAMLRHNHNNGRVDNVFDHYGKPREYLDEFQVEDGVYATFYPAQGHILGASSILLRLEKENLRVLFSGDLGNTNKYMLDTSGDPPEADIVIMESTYGDREHHPDFKQSLSDMHREVNESHSKRGNSILPVLSIHKLQEGLFHVNEARRNGEIPRSINMVVETKLGEAITKIYAKNKNRKYFSERAQEYFSNPLGIKPFDCSEEINPGGRNIILTSSGLDGLRGRFCQHFSELSDERNSIIVTTYKIPGSPLDDIAKGKRHIGTNGRSIEINAQSLDLPGISSHCDATQAINWLRKTKAKFIILVHGEKPGIAGLKELIVRSGICPEKNILTPSLYDEFDLSNLQRSNGTYSAHPTPVLEQKPQITLMGHKIDLTLSGK